MANTRVFPIPPNFNLQEMASAVAQIYQTKGFTVTVMPISSGVVMDFQKGSEGITKYIGLALSIRANIMLQNGNVIADFVDAEWTGKLIGYFIGSFCCGITTITAIIGCLQQVDLPKSIGNDIQATSNAVPSQGV